MNNIGYTRIKYEATIQNNCTKPTAWATLFLLDINRGTWPSRLGSLNIETIKYGHESREAQTREILHWRGPATIENYRPDLSSERALHSNKSINRLKNK
jgi:hypothetical protein